MGDNMDLKRAFKNFVEDNELKINVIKNKVNIINYTKVGHFDSEKVIINYEEEKIIIKGNNLVVTKLLHDEILIAGTIKIIELG